MRSNQNCHLRSWSWNGCILVLWAYTMIKKILHECSGYILGTQIIILSCADYIFVLYGLNWLKIDMAIEEGTVVLTSISSQLEKWSILLHLSWCCTTLKKGLKGIIWVIQIAWNGKLVYLSTKIEILQMMEIGSENPGKYSVVQPASVMREQQWKKGGRVVKLLPHSARVPG